MSYPESVRERIWNWIPRYSTIKRHDRKKLSPNPMKNIQSSQLLNDQKNFKTNQYAVWEEKPDLDEKQTSNGWWGPWAHSIHAPTSLPVSAWDPSPTSLAPAIWERNGSVFHVGRKRDMREEGRHQILRETWEIERGRVKIASGCFFWFFFFLRQLLFF